MLCLSIILSYVRLDTSVIRRRSYRSATSCSRWPSLPAPVRSGASRRWSSILRGMRTSSLQSPARDSYSQRGALPALCATCAAICPLRCSIFCSTLLLCTLLCSTLLLCGASMLCAVLYSALLYCTVRHALFSVYRRIGVPDARAVTGVQYTKARSRHTTLPTHSMLCFYVCAAQERVHCGPQEPTPGCYRPGETPDKTIN